jgi:hypothetical protein
MNILILILANDTPIYIEMQNIWKKYMNKHENIKSYFIKYKENLDNDIYLSQEDNTIYIKGIESFVPGVLDKTIKSIEYCIKNIKFDYLFRTNMSSFLLLDKLYKYCLNNKIDCGGLISHHFDSQFINGTKFISGSGILLSTNACNFLIENKNDINYQIPDDVEIACILQKKYDFTLIQRNDKYINIPFIKESVINSDVYHYRCKNNYGILDYETIETMKSLYEMVYM